jgi:hypothetical protein
MKSTFMLLIALIILGFIKNETPAQCKARCYHENNICCEQYKDECGTKCFEEARKCYSGCIHLSFLAEEFIQ